MKKLMIAAAIVCAAAFAQAATCYWVATTSKEIYEGNDSDIYSGTAYFFQKTDTMTAAILLSTLADGTKDISKVAGAKAVTVGDGLLDTQVFTTEGTGTGTQSFLFAVQMADQVFIWEGDKLNNKTESALESGTALSFNPKSASQSVIGAAGDGYTSAGWYTTGDVPEPTSAMLLLLGVAGLALRRRHA